MMNSRDIIIICTTVIILLAIGIFLMANPFGSGETAILTMESSQSLVSSLLGIGTCLTLVGEEDIVAHRDVGRCLDMQGITYITQDVAMVEC